MTSLISFGDFMLCFFLVFSLDGCVASSLNPMEENYFLSWGKLAMWRAALVYY